MSDRELGTFILGFAGLFVAAVAVAYVIFRRWGRRDRDLAEREREIHRAATGSRSDGDEGTRRST